MLFELLKFVGASVFVGVLGYLIGQRAERHRLLAERKLQARDRLISTIGEAITEMRGELASHYGDDVEASDKRFDGIALLGKLQGILDLEHPYLTERERVTCKGLCRFVRIYAERQLYLRAGSITQDELNAKENLDFLIRQAAEVQGKLT